MLCPVGAAILCVDLGCPFGVPLPPRAVVVFVVLIPFAVFPIDAVAVFPFPVDVILVVVLPCGSLVRVGGRWLARGVTTVVRRAV